MAKKAKPEGKKYSYMDTYGDLVTLLLCFFVLLFSMSTVEEVKYNAFVEALSERFGEYTRNLSMVSSSSPQSGSDFGEEPPEGNTPPVEVPMPADLQKMAEAIEAFVAENNLQGEISVEFGENDVAYIRLSNNLLFAGDSSDLRANAIVFLEFLAECFGELEEQIFQVKCMGHTATAAGSGMDSFILSSARAGEVASYLSNRGGFPGTKVETIGHGRYYPIADNSIEAERAKNRRVDIVVIGNNSDTLADALMEVAKVYFPSDDTSFFQGTPEELPENMLNEVPPNADGGVSVDLNDLTSDDIKDILGSGQTASSDG